MLASLDTRVGCSDTDQLVSHSVLLPVLNMPSLWMITATTKAEAHAVVLLLQPNHFYPTRRWSLPSKSETVTQHIWDITVSMSIAYHVSRPETRRVVSKSFAACALIAF
jgi:hypothetical protein